MRLRPLLAGLIPTLGLAGLLLLALPVHLPTPDAPLKIYSTELRSDLKRTLIKALKTARQSITIQIYGLSDPDILHLLERKQAEGIHLRVFHDKKGAPRLPRHLAAYPVHCSGLMHRKIVVIDNELTLIGTANFTTASLKMHENLILGIWNPSLANFLAESIKEEGVFQIGHQEIESYLLPEGGESALNAIIRELDGAKKRIELAIFTLTHPLLLEKLLSAKKRGVTVTIAIDRYAARGASKKGVELLEQHGIKVAIHKSDTLLHHKWALIDGKTLILGSANWTKSAFAKNQDCLLICKNLENQEKTLRKIWKRLLLGC